MGNASFQFREIVDHAGNKPQAREVITPHGTPPRQATGRCGPSACRTLCPPTMTACSWCNAGLRQDRHATLTDAGASTGDLSAPAQSETAPSQPCEVMICLDSPPPSGRRDFPVAMPSTTSGRAASFASAPQEAPGLKLRWRVPSGQCVEPVLCRADNKSGMVRRAQIPAPARKMTLQGQDKRHTPRQAARSGLGECQAALNAPIHGKQNYAPDCRHNRCHRHQDDQLPFQAVLERVCWGASRSVQPNQRPVSARHSVQGESARSTCSTYPPG